MLSGVVVQELFSEVVFLYLMRLYPRVRNEGPRVAMGGGGGKPRQLIVGPLWSGHLRGRRWALGEGVFRSLPLLCGNAMVKSP